MTALIKSLFRFIVNTFKFFFYLFILLLITTIFSLIIGVLLNLFFPGFLDSTSYIFVGVLSVTILALILCIAAAFSEKKKK